jgi:hypothetical protein
MNAIIRYFAELGQSVSSGWNRFWFTASDAFSLSVLRILTGSLAVLYHFSFTADLVNWFGSAGILPIETAKRISESPQYNTFYLSYFYFFDAPAALWVVHFIGLAILLMFVVGAFTRVTSVLSLVVVLSYMHRAPMLTGHMEPLVAMLLFYLCFAPAGRYLSIDRWLRKRKLADQPTELQGEDLYDKPSVWATISLRAMQIHVVGFYFMMALTKFRGVGWWNGEAIWGLLAYSESRLIDLTFLHGSEYLLDFWTHMIVLFELLLPVLVWNRALRPLMLGIAVFMWTLLALVTGLVGFALVMIVASLAFVPAETWRGIVGSLGRRRLAVSDQPSANAVA